LAIVVHVPELPVKPSPVANKEPKLLLDPGHFSFGKYCQSGRFFSELLRKIFTTFFVADFGSERTESLLTHSNILKGNPTFFVRRERKSTPAKKGWSLTAFPSLGPDPNRSEGFLLKSWR
jgi:hypothetical protein